MSHQEQLGQTAMKIMDSLEALVPGEVTIGKVMFVAEVEYENHGATYNQIWYWTDETRRWAQRAMLNEVYHQL